MNYACLWWFDEVMRRTEQLSVSCHTNALLHRVGTTCFCCCVAAERNKTLQHGEETALLIVLLLKLLLLLLFDVTESA